MGKAGDGCWRAWLRMRRLAAVATAGNSTASCKCTDRSAAGATSSGSNQQRQPHSHPAVLTRDLVAHRRGGAAAVHNVNVLRCKGRMGWRTIGIWEGGTEEVADTPNPERFRESRTPCSHAQQRMYLQAGWQRLALAVGQVGSAGGVTECGRGILLCRHRRSPAQQQGPQRGSGYAL